MQHAVIIGMYLLYINYISMAVLTFRYWSFWMEFIWHTMKCADIEFWVVWLTMTPTNVKKIFENILMHAQLASCSKFVHSEMNTKHSIYIKLKSQQRRFCGNMIELSKEFYVHIKLLELRKLKTVKRFLGWTSLCCMLRNRCCDHHVCVTVNDFGPNCWWSTAFVVISPLISPCENL